MYQTTFFLLSFCGVKKQVSNVQIAYSYLIRKTAYSHIDSIMFTFNQITILVVAVMYWTGD